jgi:hypothetical protein
MRFRERSHDDEERQQHQPDGSGGSPGEGLAHMRQAGEDFLRAGDDAINRALSGNSEAFLAANRQQGGE